MEETTGYPVTLPLRNATAKPIQVNDLQAGCTCVEISQRQFMLKPGETTDVRLKLDLTKRAPWERHGALRPLQITIRPYVEGEPRTKGTWTLEGTIRSRVTADVETLNFGDRTVSGAANEPRTVEARVYEPTARLTATVSPSQSGSVSLTARAEGRYAVTITPSASLPPGPFQFDVLLGVADGGEAAKPVLPIHVTGVMQPEVRAFPAQVFLGPRPTGTTAETTVRLQSPPGAGWEVDRIEVDSADVKVSPNADGYRVAQVIKQEGDVSSVIRFFVRRGNKGPVVPLETTVTYFGQRAEVRR